MVSRDRAPLESWSLTFLVVTGLGWCGLCNHIPFKVSICCVFILLGCGSQIAIYKTKLSLLVEALTECAAVLSGGVFGRCMLRWPADLGPWSHYSKIPSTFWWLSSSISRSSWSVLDCPSNVGVTLVNTSTVELVLVTRKNQVQKSEGLSALILMSIQKSLEEFWMLDFNKC